MVKQPMDRERADSERQALWVSLAAVLHDIRNPLHNTTLLAESLGAEGVDPALVRDQMLEQLDRVHSRISRVMAQMAEFVGEFRCRPVRLTQMVSEAVAMIEPQAREFGVSLGMDCADQLVIKANPSFLAQALEHLMLNCLEVLAGQPEDKPRRLWVSAKREKSLVWLSVQDSGPGLPPEILHSPFEPLAAPRSRGMGLGLALAHALARAGGGELTLHCTNEMGTHFRIRLEGMP